MTTDGLDYPDDYKEMVFYAWYRAGHPGMSVGNVLSVRARDFINSLPPAPDGRVPAFTTVLAWIKRNGWRDRAEVLDAEASVTFDREVINERVATIKKLTEGAQSVLDKAIEYFKDTKSPFSDNPSAAVRAVIGMSEMVFKYKGAADKLVAISQMTDKQIEAKIMSILGTQPNEDEETTNVILEDVPEDAEDDNAE